MREQILLLYILCHDQSEILLRLSERNVQNFHPSIICLAQKIENLVYDLSSACVRILSS